MKVVTINLDDARQTPPKGYAFWLIMTALMLSSFLSGLDLVRATFPGLLYRLKLT